MVKHPGPQRESANWCRRMKSSRFIIMGVLTISKSTAVKTLPTTFAKNTFTLHSSVLLFQIGVIVDSMADPCRGNYVSNPDGAENSDGETTSGDSETGLRIEQLSR